MGKVRLMSIAALLMVGMASVFAWLNMMQDAETMALCAIAVAILAHLE